MQQPGPGAAFHAPHDAALGVLVQGMIDLKLCEGSVEGVLESGDYRRFLHASDEPLAGPGCP